MTISFIHKPNSVYEVPADFAEEFYKERLHYEAAIKECNDRFNDSVNQSCEQVLRIEETWRGKLRAKDEELRSLKAQLYYITK